MPSLKKKLNRVVPQDFQQEKRSAKLRRYALWGLAVGLGLAVLTGIIILSGGGAIPGIGALIVAFTASPYLTGFLIPLAFVLMGAITAALGALVAGIKAGLDVEKLPLYRDSVSDAPYISMDADVSFSGIKFPSEAGISDKQALRKKALFPRSVQEKTGHLPLLTKHTKQRTAEMAVLEKKVKRVKIPYLHPKVDLDDLQNNGKLLTDKEISLIQSLNLPPGKQSKADLQKIPGLENLQFSVTRTEDGYFAHYKGVKQAKALGVGGFGKAKLIQQLDQEENLQAQDTGNWYALKLIKNTRAEKIEQETYALKKASQYKASFEAFNKKQEHQYAIVMKLGKGNNVYNILQPDIVLPPIMWMNLAIDCLLAFDEIHQEKRLLHCDIKGDNLIYDRFHRTLMPIDWGAALEAQGDVLEAEGQPEGTMGFIAPEILALPWLDKQYTEKTEVYQLGVTLAECFALTFLDSEGVVTMIKNTSSRLFIMNSRIPDIQIREAILHYLKKMTATNPLERPTLREALAFFQNIRDHQLDLFSKILSIAYLNVDDYKHAGHVQRKKIQRALKSANVVCLIDTAGHSESAYPGIKKELEKQKLLVGDEVIQTSSQNLVANLRDYTRLLSCHAECIANTFYVCTKTEKSETALKQARIFPILVNEEEEERVNYAEPMKKRVAVSTITEGHFTLVLTCLAGVLKKNSQAAEEIQDLMETIIRKNDSENGLSYGELNQSLQFLQEDLREGHALDISMPLEALTFLFIEEARTAVVFTPKSKPPCHNPHEFGLRI